MLLLKMPSITVAAAAAAAAAATVSFAAAAAAAAAIAYCCLHVVRMLCRHSFMTRMGSASFLKERTHRARHVRAAPPIRQLAGLG